MYIEKIEIGGFGKISNLKIRFHKGLNIVYGPNESGKTTIQWFIKGMLFGLKGGRASKDGVPPPLKRYKPWSGSVYGGALEYRLHNGEFYRIERDFETGKVSVYDSMYNDVTSQFASLSEKGLVTAEKHLYLNEACFDKTGFIRQMDSGIDEQGKKELLSRITNIVETGFEDVSFRKAEKALKDSILEYIGSDRTTKRPMDRINSRLEELIESRNTLIKMKEEYSQISKKLDWEREVLKRIVKRKEFLQKSENFLKTRKETEKLRRQIKEIGNILNEVLILEENYKKASKELESFEKSQFLLQKDISGIGTGDKKDGLKILKKKKKAYVTGMIVFSAVSLILIISDFFFKNNWVRAFSLLLAALAVLSAFLTGRISSEQVKLQKNKGMAPPGDYDHNMYLEKASAVLELERKLKEKLGKAYIITGTEINSSEDIKSLLERIEDKYDECMEILKKHVKEIESIAGSTNTVNNAGSTNSKDSNNINNSNKAEISSGFWVLDLVNIEKPLSDADIESIELMLDFERKKTEEEYTGSLQKITEYEVLLRTLENDKDELQKVDEEIEELNREKRKLESLDFSLRTALEVLTQASKEIQRDYIPVLNSKVTSIFERITNSKYNDIRADEKFQLRTVDPETGKVTNTNILSCGTIEQVYLALRVSMAEMLENPEEMIPFFMDEIFAYYDDNRINCSLALLKELSYQRQIILFTCKGREVEAAARLCGEEVNIIKL